MIPEAIEPARALRRQDPLNMITRDLMHDVARDHEMAHNIRKCIPSTQLVQKRKKARELFV